MSKNQILSTRRRADRIRLHKPHSLKGAFECGRWEEVTRDGKPPQIIQGHRHDPDLLIALV